MGRPKERSKYSIILNPKEGEEFVPEQYREAYRKWVADWSDKRKHPNLFNHILKIGLKRVATSFFPGEKDVKENGFVLEFTLVTFLSFVMI